MKIDEVAIGTVLPYEKNPRRNVDAVAKVAASIREFGFRQPIVVDEAGVIIVGHTRLLAARRLGLEVVPVHVARGLSEAQVRAYRLADNRSHEEAQWDVGLLAEELRALDASGFDLALTAFDSHELANLLKAIGSPEKDPDSAPPVPKEVRSVPGVIWLLGPHRVGCADSTRLDQMEAVLGSALADVVWTDPPYNVAYKTKAGSIANDDLASGEFQLFLRDAFTATFGVMKPGAAIYVAHADTEGLNFRTAFKAAAFKISGCIIWRKDALVLGRSDYQWQHEPILYGWKPGSAHRWYGGRKQTTVLDLGDGSPFAQMADGRWQITVGDRVMVVSGDASVEELVPSVITEARPKKSELHPTMKPTALIERLLKNNARPGDLVFDPFGGSGSTLIAADRLGMVATLCELDPGYCDVIVARWQEYSGRKATRASDGMAFDDVPARLSVKAA